MVSANQLTDAADWFRKAVELLGSQNRTGILVGLTQPAISKILKKGGVCPDQDGAVIKVEAATGISRHKLRPDLYPDERTPPDAALDRRDPGQRYEHAR